MVINATEFKAKCLSLMEYVQSKQEEIIITNHGKAIAKLVPSESDQKISSVGFLKGKVKIEGDIVGKL
jgi:prevent-host-death family protein